MSNKWEGGEGVKSVFPGTRELLMLHVLLRLFPSSDLQHPVITPLYLLLARYLDQSLVVNKRDLAAGLFLCFIYLEVIFIAIMVD